MRRSPGFWNMISALFALVSISTVINAATAAATPVAQILAPESGFKLRPGQTTSVRIRVVHSSEVISGWTLSLVGADGNPQEIARGASDVSNDVVAQISSHDLVPGEQYRIWLDVQDASGTGVRAESSLFVPDPQYALIPLLPYKMPAEFYGQQSVDGSGDIIVVGGPTDSLIEILNRATGSWKEQTIPAATTYGQKLSTDGSTFYFESIFNTFGKGIGVENLATGAISPLAPATPLFTVSASGMRVALQNKVRLPGETQSSYQYFFYDQSTGLSQQITNDSQAIVVWDAPTYSCPGLIGSTPFITADGQHVVFITSATLGIVPVDPSVGCRVFVFDIETGETRHLAAFPASEILDLPALSDDGRFLSYTSLDSRQSRPVSAGLLDLVTGQVMNPIASTAHFASFDSLVTRDGKQVLISSKEDLDPRVGNADHNMELFLFDIASHEFTQVSETLGGIAAFSRNCPVYGPAVSGDGNVMVFTFEVLSGIACVLDGAQRNETDNLVLGRVRAVRKRPNNHAPILRPLEATRVLAGQPVRLELSATDPDGDPITLFAQLVDESEFAHWSTTSGLPVGAGFEDHHNGTATLSWNTTNGQAGTYLLRAAAFDEGGGEQFQDVTISVLSSSCTGHCNGDQQVTIDELLTAVNIALGSSAPSACPAYDSNAVAITDLMTAVNNALNGCG
jgi:Tol biopolymer transport system component